MNPIIQIQLTDGERMNVLPEMVRALRRCTLTYQSFGDAWTNRSSLSEAIPSRECAHTLWEFVRYSDVILTSSYEEALEHGCNTLIHADGFAWTEFGGEKLLFYPGNGWSAVSKPGRNFVTLQELVVYVLTYLASSNGPKEE